ncbi:MAG TPA: translation initiation factor IF-2 [Saprospiraceae bacterium]|nr:translation initiation factor IF-2 [Saprospiraceae bacterium]
MAVRRLVNIATELNVATTTVVEYLSTNGFDIENKPTAKISDDMYAALLKQFSGSIAVKEQADKLSLGRHAKEGDQKGAKPGAHVETAIPKKALIDLTAPSAKPEPENGVPVAKPASDKTDGKKHAVTEIPVAEPPVQEPPPAEPTPPPQEELLRAETPQLKGLKILGKIDATRLEKPKAKKQEVEEREDKKGQPASSADSADKKRRRRKRRKITQADVQKDDKSKGLRKGVKKDESREVSQKEIEEQIRVTMARLTGTGKNKRQKIRRESRDKKHEKAELLEAEGENLALELTEFVSVSELASLLNVAVADVITTCMNLGVIVSINQRLDAEIIELVSNEFGHEVKFISAEEREIEDDDEEDDPAELQSRAPIVTVMGHVDHGKTSLLDYIRSANVVAGEAGGITQHIGAYEVNVNDKKITFLDTPGHEAFTAMRARGAKLTDVAVIIVAADDNIMPQTKEAISHAQAASVPIVFAINKIDKPGADPDRIKNELAQMNFLVESWGGKYQSQDISAKTGKGVDLLLEKITLEADLLDLKANPKRLSTGAVIEAALDKGRGYVAKLLVQNGTLNIGDVIVVGEYSGKVKAMFNERGKKVKSAGPSTPVLVLGLDGAPQAGEKFKETESEQDARRIAAQRAQISREQSNRAAKRISLDEIGRRLALGNFKELKLIVKGDVDGSVEALTDALLKLSIEKVAVSVIHQAVGQIVESDVLLASASDAIIIGFQVRPSLAARKLAEQEGVEIKMYSIIYEAINEIKAAIEGMLEPTKEEKILGQVEVREVFKISRIGTIAGCYVHEGKITRNSFIRIVRDGIVVYPTKEGVHGEISTLKRFKDDAKEVKAGLECGITIKNFNDIKVGDFIEAYEIEVVKAKLDK